MDAILEMIAHKMSNTICQICSTWFCKEENIGKWEGLRTGPEFYALTAYYLSCQSNLQQVSAVAGRHNMRPKLKI